MPLRKKGEGKRVEDYRGVTLLNTMYKVYTMVERRLEEEMEEKRMLPDSQAGFRRGRGTMDNVYVLNCVVNKELQEERGEVDAFSWTYEWRLTQWIEESYGRH